MNKGKATSGNNCSGARTDGSVDAESPRAHINVLLVEGDAEQARHLQTLLGKEDSGFNVEWVDCLSPAVDRLGKGGIDVVLAALSLSDSQGTETIAKIRHSAGGVAVVAIIDDEGPPGVDLLAAGAHECAVRGRLDSFWLPQLISNAVARVRLQQNVDPSDARFRALVEHSTDGILVISANGTVVYDSPGLKGMLGYEKGENLGAQGFDFLHPDDVAEATKAFGEVFAIPGKSVAAKFRVKHKDGTWHHVEGTCTNHLDDPDVKGVVVNFRDVVERERAQEAIRSNEERLKAIFEGANDGMVFIDNEAKVVDVNIKAQRMLGYTREEVVGKSVFELNILAPEEMGKLAEVYMQMAAGGDNAANVLEIMGVRKDGSRIPLEISDTIVRDASGNMVGMLTIMRDITERKRSEEAVQEQERKFKQLFTNVSDAVVFVDLTGKVLDANKRLQELVGYPVEESVGRNFSELPAFSQETLSTLASQIAQAISVGATESIVSVPARHRDGHQLYLEASTCMITGANGEPQGFVSLLRDITERKNAEDALLESERRFHAIFDNPMNFVFIHDALGVFVDANDAALNRLGYTREDLGRLSFLDVAYQDDVQGALEALGQTTTAKGFMDKPVQLRVRSKTGEVLWVEAYGYTVAHQGQYHGLVIAEDITERKGMEDELRQFAEALSAQNVQLDAAREELTSLNQNLEQKVKERTAEVEKLLTQKDEFIRQLGHDLKSPLTPLVALLPLMREDMQDPEQQEMMDAAIQNVYFMRDLVVKTLKLARLTSGKVGPITAKAKMRKQLDAVLRGRKSVADKKGVKIETSVDDGIVVQLEEIDLQELFDNTMTNAIKFTPEGGTVFINAAVSEPFVTVSVKDTGIGMTSEQLSHLFQEFYKADTSRHELDSSGLGLSICKRIVERAGGRIWAESEGPGKGSTICFTLPLSRVESGSGGGKSGVKDREGVAGQPTMIEYAAEPVATEESDRSAADLSGRSEGGR